MLVYLLWGPQGLKPPCGTWGYLHSRKETSQRPSPDLPPAQNKAGEASWVLQS